MSLFSAVEMAPRDPILGLNEAFNADTRPGKINLGVGVYYNEEGRIPLLRAVQAAEKARIEAHAPRGYLPIEGIAAYDQGVQKLLFGNESELLAAGRVVTTRPSAAPAPSSSAPTSSSACCPTPPWPSATRAGKTTAHCSKPPASRCRTTAITTPPAMA